MTARIGPDAAHVRIDVLDGWRAVSILMVIAGHWFPLGPKMLKLNGAFAAAGMAIFFTLSGLLITRFLLDRADVIDFLLRRFFRILPLAWAAMAVLAIANGSDLLSLAANFLFFANLPPAHLYVGGEHLWSLCVEIQFYVGIAALVAAAGRKGLYLLPLLCIAVTIGRVMTGNLVSIFTWFRIDEILAGASLALLLHSPAARIWMARVSPWVTVVALPLLLASAHDDTAWLNYVRPYIAATMVGASIFAIPAWLRSMLVSRTAKYIAETSYALYVFHGMLTATWLGSGDVYVKYAKRPLLVVLTFALAHVSTFRFERPMIGFGKRVSKYVLARGSLQRV